MDSHCGIPAVKSHTVCHDLLISRFWGVFSRKFSFGVKPELFYLLLAQKHQEGAGLAQVELSPPQTKASYLSILWVSAVLGERTVLNSWNDAQLPPCSDLARAIRSWRQIQADRETHLIGAQCLYWRRLLLLFPPPKEFFH